MKTFLRFAFPAIEELRVLCSLCVSISKTKTTVLDCLAPISPALEAALARACNGAEKLFSFSASLLHL
jgi:hypothetical protein